MSELRTAREAAGLSLEEASRRTRIPERYLVALETGDHSVFPAGPFLSGYTRQYRGFLQLPERTVALTPVEQPPPRAMFGRRRSEPRRAPAREEPPRRGEAPRPAPQVDDEPAFEGQPPRDFEPVVREAPRARRREQPERTAPAVPGRETRRGVLRLTALGALVAAVVVLSVAVFQAAFPPPAESVGQAPDQHVSLAAVAPVRARVEADGHTALDGSLLPGPARTFDAHDRIAIELETLDGVTIQFDGRTLTPLGARSRPRRLVFIDDKQP